MDPLDVGDVGSPRTGKIDFRTQDHTRHRVPAVAVAFEKTDCMIDIAIDDEALFRRDRQEEQHVATRQRGDERLFRIDRACD